MTDIKPAPAPRLAPEQVADICAPFYGARFWDQLRRDMGKASPASTRIWRDKGLPAQDRAAFLTAVKARRAAHSLLINLSDITARRISGDAIADCIPPADVAAICAPYYESRFWTPLCRDMGKGAPHAVAARWRKAGMPIDQKAAFLAAIASRKAGSAQARARAVDLIKRESAY